MKTLIRAAENKQKGRMRPAGRQFDMPDIQRPPQESPNSGRCKQVVVVRGHLNSRISNLDLEMVVVVSRW